MGYSHNNRGRGRDSGYVVYLIVVLVPAAVAAKCAVDEKEPSTSSSLLQNGEGG